MEEIGAYDRGSSDESRQSDGGSDDDIQSKEPESGFGSEGEAETCDNERAADGFRVQSEIENEEMEQSMDDDDETTDSRTEPINESMQLRKLAKLASEFNKTVNEIRERSRQQAFQFPRDAVSTSNRRKKRMGRSESGTDDNDMSDSISSQLSRTPRKRRIAKWEVLSEIQKSEHTKEEAFNHFAKIAKDELAKGGPVLGYVVKEGDLGGFRRNRVSIILRSTQSSRILLIFMVAQIYKSVAASHAGVEKIQWTCPLRHLCGCMVSLAVKEFPERFVLMRSGEHDLHSHDGSTGILNVKQKNAVIASVRSCPMITGNAVQSNLKNFSPDKHVPTTAHNCKAVNRLVSKTRSNLMRDRMQGTDIDGSEGSMIQLAESLSLVQFIKRHNDPDDPFHMDEHQVVCCGYQFSHGVRFMNLSTAHLMNNFARSENAGWQKYMHLDGAYIGATRHSEL